MQRLRKDSQAAEGEDRLSIPFVGFLRMQRRNGRSQGSTSHFVCLSIPFVGFLRMQRQKKNH